MIIYNQDNLEVDTIAMEEILEEVDVDLFVNQPVPEDPEKLRLSLIFSKDLITTLQQDIADLHHRLQIADDDGTQEMEEDEEDDKRAGVHVTNATLTKMDGDLLNSINSLVNINNNDDDDVDLYGYMNGKNGTQQNISRKVKIASNKLYEMSNDNDVETGGNDIYDEKADLALNKKLSMKNFFQHIIY